MEMDEIYILCVDLQEIIWRVGGRVVLQGLSSCGSEDRQVSGSCEYSGKLLGSINCGNFLTS